MKVSYEKYWYEGLHIGYTATTVAPQKVTAIGVTRKEALQRLNRKLNIKGGGNVGRHLAKTALTFGQVKGALQSFGDGQGNYVICTDYRVQELTDFINRLAAAN